MFILAIASISCLALAAFATVLSDVPLTFGEFKLKTLKELVEDAYGGATNVPLKLAATFYTMIEWMREDNDKRYRYYRFAVAAAGFSIIVSTGELISSLAFRIPG